jgi:GH15 family glucan-1,4-alpha-glucosidase
LFSEEFEPKNKELLGNFPQALSHLAHINATLMLHRGPSAIQRKDQMRES